MAYQEVKVKQPLLLTILPILSLATFFFGWQALVSWNIIPNELLASPIQVFHTFLDKLHDPMPDGAVLSTHIWTSLKEAFIGYGLSLLVGIPLGLAMGWFRGFEQRLPHQDNVHLTISFHDGQCPEEAVLVAEVEAFGFKVVEVSYAIDRRSQRVSYLMLLQAGAPVRSGELACRLKALSGLADFNLSPWRS